MLDYTKIGGQNVELNGQRQPSKNKQSSFHDFDSYNNKFEKVVIGSGGV